MRFVKIILEMCDVRFATGKSALYFTSSYVSINRKNSEEILNGKKGVLKDSPLPWKNANPDCSVIGYVS